MEDTERGTYGITDKRVVCGSGYRAAPLIMGKFIEACIKIYSHYLTNRQMLQRNY
jgi:hypothetical protein